MNVVHFVRLPGPGDHSRSLSSQFSSGLAFDTNFQNPKKWMEESVLGGREF